MDIALSEDRLRTLEEAEALQSILRSMGSGALFDLTFHSSFAIKLFEVMRREGPAVQGFDRMQQSFGESVKQVRTLLSSIPDATQSLGRFLAMTPESQTALVRLMRDLAKFKSWMLDEKAHKT